MKPTIITAAVTGAVTTREQTPYLPVTPKEIADSGIDCINKGASIIHVHVRDPISGKPSMKTEYYKEVHDRIKQKHPESIINLSTGPGSTGPDSAVIKHYSDGPDAVDVFKSAEERTKHILEIQPDICSLDLNTMNRGVGRITINTIEVAKKMCEFIAQTKTKPELELFDSGDVSIAHNLMQSGHLPNNPFWQICLGVKWGWEASAETLIYAKNLLPKNVEYSAFGIGRWQMPIVAQSFILGGHTRVGLEDNIYLKKGELAKSNGDLVSKAAEIIDSLGGRLATISEARSTLNI